MSSMSQVGEWKNQESECDLFESVSESVTEIGNKTQGSSCSGYISTTTAKLTGTRQTVGTV